MGKTCASCGSAHASNAAYCAHCGHSLKSSASAKKSAKSGNNRAWRMPAAIIVGLLALGALYFWLFIADDLQKSADIPATEAPDSARPDAQIFFAMIDGNIRDKPTTSGSTVLGKLPRGSQVTGTVQRTSGANAEWLELSDGNGFIALVNLTQYKPPVLARSLNNQIWVADGLIDVWATPLPDSILLDRVRDGTKLTLTGVTADNFLEVKLAGGRYGYLADATSILARLGGKPVAIDFNPQTCAFAGEIGAEFAKIGAQLQAQWRAIESKEFADEAARDKAFAKAEGVSTYVRLRRSFEGLSLTALGQHYESQSLYFDDSPAKVIEVFRAQGFNIGRDGLFQSTELYAGITATRGESAAYGKTELGCGV